MSLRSGRNINPAAASVTNQRKGSAGNRPSRKNKQHQQASPAEETQSHPNDNQRQQASPVQDDQSHPNTGTTSNVINTFELNSRTTSNDTQKSSNNPDKPKEFVSSFPSLSIENMEQELDKWTLVDLRNALTQEKKNRSRHKNQAHTEIDNLVKLIRLDYEKRMLMAALIGGISETMVWSLVDTGPQKGKSSSWSRFLSFGIAPLGVKMPHRDDKPGWAIQNKQLRDIWDDMSIDEKTVFKSPYFFALAKLPDLSKPSVVAELEDDDQDFNEEDVLAQVSTTPVHQLSEEDELLYRPIFNRLVDVEKVHANHGKPQSSDSTASLQLKSLAGFRAAHHNFATACQRFHIHYYLSALSCDITNNGWNEVYSTNKSFAEWADETMSLTTEFKYYVHGKAVAREIEKKPPQLVDARRAELTRELNRLIDEHVPGKVFPKTDDPAGVIRSRGWPIRLVLTRPDSALLPEELDLGFRLCDDGQKKKWISDIKNGYFYIEKLPPSECLPLQKCNRKKQSRKGANSSTATQQTSAPISTNQTSTEDLTTSQNQSSTIENTQTTQITNSATPQSLNTEQSKKKSARTKSKKPKSKKRKGENSKRGKQSEPESETESETNLELQSSSGSDIESAS